MDKIRKISPKEFDDSDIIEGLALGNTAAIQYVYNNFFGAIERMVLRNSGNKDQAKDLFQETILVLYDRITTKGIVLECKLSSFLYAISRRLWLKQLNKKNYDTISIHEEIHYGINEEEDIDLHLETELKFKQMEDALQTLGSPCKQILEEFYLLGKSMAEICKKFNYTNPANAKTQKYKCLQRLKKIYFK